MRLVWTVSPTAGLGVVAAHGLFAVLSAVLLVSVLVPPFHAAPMACLVQLLLGMAGPGCGMTRAFLYIGHGDPVAALALNPNSLLVFTIVVALWINGGLRLLRGREVALILSRRWQIALPLAAAVLTGAAWIYNLTVNPSL